MKLLDIIMIPMGIISFTWYIQFLVAVIIGPDKIYAGEWSFNEWYKQQFIPFYFIYALLKKIQDETERRK